MKERLLWHLIELKMSNIKQSRTIGFPSSHAAVPCFLLAIIEEELSSKTQAFILESKKDDDRTDKIKGKEIRMRGT